MSGRSGLAMHRPVGAYNWSLAGQGTGSRGGPQARMAKVLVVDDQRNMRSTLSLMLRDAGYEVVEARDGEHACDLLVADAFELVLTDLKMGATDGIHVLRQVKEASPLTEVIVMTAFGTIESAVEAMRLGA